MEGNLVKRRKEYETKNVRKETRVCGVGGWDVKIGVAAALH